MCIRGLAARRAGKAACVGLLAILTALLSVSSQGVAQLEGRLREWTVPVVDAQPAGIAVDAQGAVWVTLRRANQIARLDPASGEWELFVLPTANSGPLGIAADADGNIWYAASTSGKIGRVEAQTGKITEFTVPGNADAHSMAFAPDGTLWFTAERANRIFKLDPKTGGFGKFTVPTPEARPQGIAIGSDGAPWFCESGTNRLARVDPARGRITEIEIPFADARPRQLVVLEQPVRAIYYTDAARGALGRLDLVRMSFRDWLSPSGKNAQPEAIAADEDGYLWYSELRANQLVRFDPETQTFRRFTLPAPRSEVRAMITDQKGRIWMALTGANKIAVVE